MAEYSFKPSELKFLWKKRGNQNYHFRHFLRGDRFGKLILLHDVAKNREVLGKIVELPAEGEAYHWNRLQHENILPLCDIVSINETARIFITPYLEKNLKDIIYETDFNQDPKCFDRKKAYVEDVLWGLDYIHRKSLCIVNLNDTKIFICSKSDKAVISDFSGLLQLQRVNKCNFALHSAYKAPELSEGADGDQFDPLATEMWACGVMIMQIFSQHMLPWATSAADVSSLVSGSAWDKEAESLRQANTGALLKSEDISGLKDFLAAFLKIEPKERTSAGKAAISEFLQCSTYRLDKKAREFWDSYEESYQHVKKKLLQNPQTSDAAQNPITHVDISRKEATNKFINLHYVHPCSGPHSPHNCIDEDYLEIWHETPLQLTHTKKLHQSQTAHNNSSDDRKVISPKFVSEDSVIVKNQNELQNDCDHYNDNLQPTESTTLNNYTSVNPFCHEYSMGHDMISPTLNLNTESGGENCKKSECISSSETLCPQAEGDCLSPLESRSSLASNSCKKASLVNVWECILDSPNSFDNLRHSTNFRRGTAKSESEVESRQQKLLQSSFKSLRNRSQPDAFEIELKDEAEHELDKDSISLIKNFSDNFYLDVPTVSETTCFNNNTMNSVGSTDFDCFFDDKLVKLLESNKSIEDGIPQNEFEDKEIATQAVPNVPKLSFSTPDQRLEWTRTNGAKRTFKCSNCDRLRVFPYECGFLPYGNDMSPYLPTNARCELRKDDESKNDLSLQKDTYKKRNASYVNAVTNGMSNDHDIYEEVHLDPSEGNGEIEMHLNQEQNLTFISRKMRQSLHKKQNAKNKEVKLKQKKCASHSEKDNPQTITTEKKGRCRFRFRKSKRAAEKILKKEQVCASNMPTITNKIISEDNVVVNTNVIKVGSIPDSSIEVSMEIPLCSAVAARKFLGLNKTAEGVQKKHKRGPTCSWLQNLCPGSKVEECMNEETFVEIPLHQF